MTARQAVRDADAVRAAAGRDGPPGSRAERARGRSRAAADHPRHARLPQRHRVHLAERRLPDRRRRGLRRRPRPPERDLHVHRRADAAADPDADPGPHRQRRPRHPADPGRRHDRAGLDACRRHAREDRRLPGPLPGRRRRVDRVDRGRLGPPESDDQRVDERHLVRLRGRGRRRHQGRARGRRPARRRPRSAGRRPRPSRACPP